MSDLRKLKEINHKIFTDNFENNWQLQMDKEALDRLYAIHFIVFTYMEINDAIKDRILKAIKKEQVMLENKTYPKPSPRRER